MFLEDPALILYQPESVGEACGMGKKTHPINEIRFSAVLVEKLRRSKIEITIHV